MIDTDVGDDIDDALALALVLRSSEQNPQVVSTVFGNTSERAQLAAYLLQVYKRPDIPVTAGRSLPLHMRHPSSGSQQAAALTTHTGD